MYRGPYALYIIFNDWVQGDEKTVHIVQQHMPSIFIAFELSYKILEDIYNNNIRTDTKNINFSNVTFNKPESTLDSTTENVKTFVNKMPSAVFHTRTNARKLQQMSNHTHSHDVNVNVNPENENRKATQSNTRTLLQTDQTTAILNRYDFSPITNLQVKIKDSTQDLYYRLLIDSSNTPCVLSRGNFVDDILISFSNTMEINGWKGRPICTKEMANHIINTPLSCPIVEAPLKKLFYNVKTLILYYITLSNTNCLQNMATSCIPTKISTNQTIESLFPSVDAAGVREVYNISSDSTNYQQKDPILDLIWALMTNIFSIFNYDITQNSKYFFAFISTDALDDDELYYSLIANSQYSVGRLIRDASTCNLETTVTCDRRQIPLIMAFVLNFIFIYFLTLFFPIPSVLVFFLWTIGLTVGVLYTAYNYSPLCAPRIPICMGSGLLELSNTLLPPKIELPHYLVNTTVCSLDLIHNNDTDPEIACLNQCDIDIIRIDSVQSILIGVESAISGGKLHLSRAVNDFFINSLSYDIFSDDIRHFETIFAQNHDAALKNSVYVCIFLNVYKVIAYIVCIYIVIPFLTYLFLFFSGVFSIVIQQGVELILGNVRLI